MRGHFGPFGEFTPERTECENQGICPYDTCHQDSHHIFFEAKDYQTKIERTFRNLGCNIIRICRQTHDEIHATQDAPDKPPRDFMVEAIVDSGINISRCLRRDMDLGEL